jgi:hypothetical protein
MLTELPNWQTGRLNAATTPKDQMDVILFKWLSGKEMLYPKWINDLMPGRDEVWEMKTADLRIFGWMYRPCVFIAAFLDYADWYKQPNPIRSYNAARERVKNIRAVLDLDEPKFTTGTINALTRI